MESLSVLIWTAVVIGVTHTAIGPDHYLPFIVLSRAEGWTLKRTLAWTFLCGLGHVGSSIVLGGLGIALGWSLSGMEWFEGIRGNAAAYVLMIFGGLYMLWGIFKAVRKIHGHSHAHVHSDGTVHTHPHDHGEDASGDTASHKGEPHEESAHVRKHRRTLWTIFIIFVLGPCEPLIPMLMVPASDHSVGGISLVAGAFSLATIGVMLGAVALGYMGLKLVRFGALERHVSIFSGAAILVSGLLIQLLGI